MKDITQTKSMVLVILLAVMGALLYACHGDRDPEFRYSLYLENNEVAQSYERDEIAVEAPPFTDGIFPCNECHGYIESNPVRRDLVDMHDDITAMFDHDSENRWCLDCHDIDSRDSLRLASGKLIGFDESYKLCGQCHGDKLRDWKVGVHGKRIGEWNGKKQYFLCVNCHNPHSPKFERLKPEPPPQRLEEMIK